MTVLHSCVSEECVQFQVTAPLHQAGLECLTTQSRVSLYRPAPFSSWWLLLRHCTYFRQQKGEWGAGGEPSLCETPTHYLRRGLVPGPPTSGRIAAVTGRSSLGRRVCEVQQRSASGRQGSLCGRCVLGAVALQALLLSQVKSPLRSSFHPDSLHPRTTFEISPPPEALREPFPANGLNLRKRSRARSPLATGCVAGSAHWGCGCGWELIK